MDSCLVQFVLQTFPRCECDRLRQWTRRYQRPPTVSCEVWFGFCRRRTSDPVKFTEDLLRSMVNMLWTWPVSENGAQCLRMGEPMFMTLRDQGDPMNSQAAVRYGEGMSKLVSRYDNCLNVEGDYVEKLVKVCHKTCIFCFFPDINKYLCMAKRSLLSRCPS